MICILNCYVFLCLQDAARRLTNITPDPDTGMADFEKAFCNACEVVFPEMELRRCLFHLYKSSIRQVGEKGFLRLYKSKEECGKDFRSFIAKTIALSFLPVDDVPAGMRHLDQNPPASCSDECLEFLGYFDRNYVTGRYRQPRDAPAPGQIARLRHTPPLYPAAEWNVRDATLNDQARTNNVCESWNRAYNSLTAECNPTIWKTILNLRKDEAATITLINQVSIGRVPTKRRHKKYADLNDRLKNLCSNYNRAELPDFLKYTAYNLTMANV